MVATDLQLGLDRVRLDKLQLIAKLKANLETHKREYADARLGWEKAVIAMMRKNLALAEEGKAFRLHVELDGDGDFDDKPVKPADHSDDYTAVIEQLEASLDSIVVISQTEFQRYYRDEWTWKEQHRSAMSSYSSSSRG